MNFFNNGTTGCGGFDRGCGCDPCNILLWIILLNSICGCGNNNTTGCGIDCCTLIILLLLCGCNK